MRSTRLTALLAGVASMAACAETTSPDLSDNRSLAFQEQQETDSTSCTLNSPLTVTVAYLGTDYTHTYTITNGTGGNYSGTATTSPSENITGNISGTTFTLNSTYTDGSNYTYSLNGTIDPATGDISGTGTSSSNQSFTFTADSAVSCTEGECPSATALANKYLRELEVKGRRFNGQNIIASIAKQMDDDGTFMNLEPCDNGYEQAVRTYIDQQLGSITTSSSKKNR